MSHYQNQHPARQTDEYGKPVSVTRLTTDAYDEYGHPIPRPDTTGTYGTAGIYGKAAAATGTDIGKEHHGVSGKLHRSGSSSSSSSSEEDGQGGRRKKGLKEKIKDKMPGHHKDEHATSTTIPGGYSSTEDHHEKKGIMEKIKEKLPGHHEHK
ncbi:hypothetical protein K2173_021407 [Erythroxylum novogranatense]|uniref:Dehydrin n=1 Tax=Erythroxylum novogranatense TaxID=1862640 RepID=A0AAV8TY32_9ROSI|nr:hypothetical protein K2173_021407 [Erythroxylum novogranatense]